MDSSLFDHLVERLTESEKIGFEGLSRIPSGGGLYSAWLAGELTCFYIGKSSNLRGRIRSHYSGQRGSDQFCLYVYDLYIHDDRPAGLKTPEVNRLTSNWIRKNISFRYVLADKTIRDQAEIHFRKVLEPILNPL